MTTRRTLLGLAALATLIPALMPAPAPAHHGWRWTTGSNIELTGTIAARRLGNPHGELQVDVEGTVWTVEVGQPWRNERAGLTDEMLAVGREITVLGQPSADANEKLVKAVRITIAGKAHDLYPERV